MKSIKLLKTKRYTIGDKTYLLGKTYSINDGLANELLRKKMDGGLPYFILSDDDPDEVLQEKEIKDAADSATKAKAKKGAKSSESNSENPDEGITSGEGDGDAVSV